MDIDAVCKMLQSAERTERQNALKLLLKYCEDLASSSDDEQQLTTIAYFDQCYLYILKCYSDRFESCREQACNLIKEFIKIIPKNDFYLQNVVTTIAARIGQQEIQEQSEEMRFIYLQQIAFLITRFHYDSSVASTGNPTSLTVITAAAADPLLKSYNEIIDICLKTLTDSCPAVQKQTCSCIQLLAAATPSFRYRAETLVKPLYPILHHKHSANRIAAIKTLGIICLHIATNYDCIKQIIAEITPLLMDSMPLVRRQCGKIGSLWLLKLKDRYSFFDRILPLVLCCLNDDSSEVREQIEKLWLKCGAQYFEENENELNRIEIIDIGPKSYPQSVEKRPTLGCRALVQKNLKLVKSIMMEVTDWKEEVRLHSLKLLRQVVLHAEVALSPMFLDILPDLCRACGDSDMAVVQMAIQVAYLMGQFLNFYDWFEHALEYVEQHPKLGCLKCFYFLYLGSNQKHQAKTVLLVAELLAKKEFSNSLKTQN